LFRHPLLRFSGLIAAGADAKGDFFTTKYTKHTEESRVMSSHHPWFSDVVSISYLACRSGHPMGRLHFVSCAFSHAIRCRLKIQ
jgi:hypothetical protein